MIQKIGTTSLLRPPRNARACWAQYDLPKTQASRVRSQHKSWKSKGGINRGERVALAGGYP